MITGTLSVDYNFNFIDYVNSSGELYMKAAELDFDVNEIFTIKQLKYCFIC